MSREILERDLDMAGLAVFNPRNAINPNDVICLRDMPTFTDGLTQDGSKVVHGDYITGKAGGQVWLGGTAANDNLTIKATSNASPTGTLSLVAAHTTLAVDQTIASATSAKLDVLKVNSATITLSGSTNISDALGFNYITLGRPTLTSASPITVTNAATLTIVAGPTETGNVTITNRYAIWIQGHGLRIDGVDDSLRAIYMTKNGSQDIAKSGGALGFGTLDNNNFGLFTNNTTRLFIGGAGQIIFTNNNTYTLVAGVGLVYRLDETVVSATSATLDNVLYDTSTITISGSTPITTATGLNNVTYRAPIYNGTPTVTNAATVTILGAPTGSAPITNKYAFWVQAGATSLQGTVIIQSLTGLLKATAGVVGVGAAGTDYESPLTFSQGVTRVSNAITGDYITGKTGNQTWTGSTDASGTLNIRSSSNAAPGSLTLTGGPIRFSAGGITVASGAGAVLDAISVPATSVTVTGTTAINTSTGFNFFSINAPTYTDGSAVTIANAATFVINGGPISGGSVSITNPYALWVQGTNGNSLFGGRVWQGSVTTAAATNQFYSQSSQTVASGASATLDSSLWDTATTTVSGSTGITTANGFNQNVFKAPVINGTVTITNSATLAIGGAPTGTATITNPFAFWVQGGTSKLAGTVIIQALTGMLKGTSGTVSVATAGTDYQAALTPADTTIAFPTGTTIKVNQLSNKFIVQGTADAMLTGAQFLGGLATGLVKNTTTTGVLSIATAGTDYESPLTFSTGLTRATNTITANITTGLSGGQTATGGTFADESLTLQSTTHSNKGRIMVGSWFALDEENQRILVGTQTAAVGAPLTIAITDGGGNLRAIHLTKSGEQDIIKTGGVLGIGTSDGQPIGIVTNNTGRISINATGQAIHGNRGSLGAVTAGNGLVLRYDASLTASAPLTWDAVLFDQSVLSLTGSTGITTPGGLNYAAFKAPSYSGGSAVTVTNAATVAISGAPTNGGNVTFTNPFAFWVQADRARFDGTADMQSTVIIRALTGLLKATSGTVTTATAGTDYENALTFSTGLTRSVNTITANLSVGIGAGQSVIGAANSSGDLTLSSTSHPTIKGRILTGTFLAFDEVNSRVLIGTQTAGVGAPLTIASTDGGGNLRAIHLTASGEQDISKTSGLLGIGTTDNNAIGIYTSNVVRVSMNGSGNTILGNKSSLGSLASGNSLVFRYDQAVTTTTGGTLDSILFDAMTTTITGAGTITTAAGFNQVTIKAPTYTSGSAVTISHASTVAISGPPVGAGTGPVTITNAAALWLQAGSLRLSGINAATQAIVLDRTGEQDIVKSGGVLVVGTSDSSALGLMTSNNVRISVNGSGQAIYSNRTSIGSVITGNGAVFRYDATVSQSAGSTLDTVLVDAGTVTLTGGTTSITTAAGFNYITIKRPIYTNASVMNITNAATLAIAGPPLPAGGLDVENILNPYSLWSQSGVVRSDGPVTIGAAISGTKMLTVVCQGGYDSIAIYPMSPNITDSSDRDFFLISPQGSGVNTGVNASHWYGVTMFSQPYTKVGGGAAPIVGEATNLRVIGEPTFSGAFTVGTRYAMHLSGGVARFDGGGAVDSEVVFEAQCPKISGNFALNSFEGGSYWLPINVRDTAGNFIQKMYAQLYVRF